MTKVLKINVFIRCFGFIRSHSTDEIKTPEEIDGAGRGRIVTMLRVPNCPSMPRNAPVFGWSSHVLRLLLMTMLSPWSIADETIILDLSDNSQINATILLERLAKADVIMLGEQHHKPEHHYIQTKIITSLLASGHRPALFFEMLSEKEEKRFRSDSSQHDRARSDMPEWEIRDRSIWSAYAPLFRLADQYELPVLHANIPVELMHNIRHFGLLAIPRSLREQLFPEQSSVELKALAERLIPTLRQTHRLSENDSTIVGLVATQLTRDAYMAWRIAHGKSPAVLIASSEHVRLDMGAAAHLKAFKPDKKIVSIVLLNYHKGWNSVEQYSTLFQQERPPFDYIWLINSGSSPPL